jgi:hypothetical protein
MSIPTPATSPTHGSRRALAVAALLAPSRLASRAPVSSAPAAFGALNITNAAIAPIFVARFARAQPSSAFASLAARPAPSSPPTPHRTPRPHRAPAFARATRARRRPSPSAIAPRVGAIVAPRAIDIARPRAIGRVNLSRDRRAANRARARLEARRTRARASPDAFATPSRASSDRAKRRARRRVRAAARGARVRRARE